MSAQVEMAKFRQPDGTIVDGVARCAVDGSKLTFCHQLDALLVAELRRQSPRVRVMPVVNLRGKYAGERMALALDLGARSLWPVAFCPFCGARVVTTYPSAERAGEGGTQ